MSSFTPFTCLSLPFTMKAGIQSTLSLSCRKRCTKASCAVLLRRPPYTRWTTEGFMVVKSDFKPTSSENGSRGARLHLFGKKKGSKYKSQNEKWLRLPNTEIQKKPFWNWIPFLCGTLLHPRPPHILVEIRSNIFLTWVNVFYKASGSFDPCSKNWMILIRPQNKRKKYISLPDDKIMVVYFFSTSALEENAWVSHHGTCFELFVL